MKKFIISIFIFLIFISLFFSCENIFEKNNLYKIKLTNYVKEQKEYIEPIIRTLRTKDNSDQLDQLQNYIENPEPCLNDLSESEKGDEAISMLVDLYENEKSPEQLKESVNSYDPQIAEEYSKIISSASNKSNILSKSYGGFFWDGFKYYASFAGVAAAGATQFVIMAKVLLESNFNPVIAVGTVRVKYGYIYYPAVAAGLASFYGQCKLINKFKTGWNGFYDQAAIVTSSEAGMLAGLKSSLLIEMPYAMEGLWKWIVGVTWPNWK